MYISASRVEADPRGFSPEVKSVFLSDCTASTYSTALGMPGFRASVPINESWADCLICAQNLVYIG